MPSRPRRPCTQPGCAELTLDGRCPAHQRQYDNSRGTAAERGYGARWRRLRMMILRRDPICRMCNRAASVHVDHIVPRARGGQDTDGNLQGLCPSCHSRKTAREDGGFGHAPREST